MVLYRVKRLKNITSFLSSEHSVSKGAGLKNLLL